MSSFTVFIYIIFTYFVRTTLASELPLCPANEGVATEDCGCFFDGILEISGLNDGKGVIFDVDYGAGGKKPYLTLTDGDNVGWQYNLYYDFADDCSKFYDNVAYFNGGDIKAGADCSNTNGYRTGRERYGNCPCNPPATCIRGYCVDSSGNRVTRPEWSYSYKLYCGDSEECGRWSEIHHEKIQIPIHMKWPIKAKFYKGFCNGWSCWNFEDAVRFKFYCDDQEVFDSGIVGNNYDSETTVNPICSSNKCVPNQKCKSLGMYKENYCEYVPDEYGFGGDGINIYTGEMYNSDGFKKDKTYRDTGIIYDTEGFDIDGLNSRKFNRAGNNNITGSIYDSNGYDIDGLNSGGFNMSNYHKDTNTLYNPSGYDVNGYDIQGFNASGYHKDTNTLYNLDGYDIKGFNRTDYHKDTHTLYNLDGYNITGVDSRGFNATGYHKDTQTIFNPGGFAVNGLNVEGFNATGYHNATHELYDPAGYNIDGFNSTGYHKVTGTLYDPVGYNIDGFNSMGYHKVTGTLYDPAGYNTYGFNSMSYHKFTGTLYGPDGFNQTGYDPRGFNITKFNKYTSTLFDPYGFDMDGFNSVGLDINGFNSSGIHNITGTIFDPDGFDVNGLTACISDGISSNCYCDSELCIDKICYNKLYKSRADLVSIINWRTKFTAKDMCKDSGLGDGIHSYGKTLAKQIEFCRNSCQEKPGFILYYDKYDTGPPGCYCEQTPYDACSERVSTTDSNRFTAYSYSYTEMVGLDDNHVYCRDFDINGFSSTAIHKDTGTKYNTGGFDIMGYHEETNTLYGPDGFDVNGIDLYGFNRTGYNKDTNTLYNLNDFKQDKTHKDTGNIYNAIGYDIDGFDLKGNRADNYQHIVVEGTFTDFKIQNKIILNVTFRGNFMNAEFKNSEKYGFGYGLSAELIELSGADDATTNLQRCVGECDNDAQCAPGLKCFERTNGEHIPGCKGNGGGDDWDYCYNTTIIPFKNEIFSSRFEGSFDGVDFTGVEFGDSYFNGTFQSAVFNDTYLYNCTLNGDFQNADFRRVTLMNTRFHGNFSGAIFKNVDLSHSDFSKVSAMFLNTAIEKCPKTLPLGFECINERIIGPYYNTETSLDWVDITKFPNIDFAGHQISLHWFNKRTLPSETMSCKDATFVENEIVSATDYVSVPIINQTYKVCKYDEPVTAGETVSLTKSWDETCEQLCSADTRQIYWSSYKEIPSTFNAGIWSSATCVCSIHNSSNCELEGTSVSNDQEYNPNPMQYDAKTFESAGTPSCEDGRYLFGARIDWRQTLNTDGWLWSMDVSGAYISFQDVQKTRRCPRDMQVGTSKAVDGVICVQGDVTPFEETTERTISMDQTADDFCANGDRVRVFNGRSDNPGISKAERFNYCAEACSKRLKSIDGNWTSNAVAFVYYEGLAGDALNGRCWCELSSGCSDTVDIDSLAHLHFVSVGAGDTSLTTSSGSGLPVYYFLGPNGRNLAVGPPSVTMNGIRSTWAFPMRYNKTYNASLYNFTGMISEKLEKCPSAVPKNYACTNIDVGHADIDTSAGYIIWGRDLELQATPYFNNVNFANFDGFSVDWFKGISYRFQDCFFDDIYGLKPLFMSPLGNVTGIDFSAWADLDEVPSMMNTIGSVLKCPVNDFNTHVDYALIKSSFGDFFTGTGPTGEKIVYDDFNMVEGRSINDNTVSELLFNIDSTHSIPNVSTDIFLRGCLDYVEIEKTDISSCTDGNKIYMGSNKTLLQCLELCWYDYSMIYNQLDGGCQCESLRYPSEECEPSLKIKNPEIVSGDQVCRDKHYEGNVDSIAECWEKCISKKDNMPSMRIKKEYHFSRLKNIVCYCLPRRILDGCTTERKEWNEEQYDATTIITQSIDAIKYNVNYCRQPWPGYGLSKDSRNTPYILSQSEIKLCPECENITIAHDCNLNLCLSCPYINFERKCLVSEWPFVATITPKYVEKWKIPYECIGNGFIGPGINVEGRHLDVIDKNMALDVVSKLVTGKGLATCPKRQYLPEGWICYKGHFHKLENLLDVENFEQYWSSRSEQITSNSSCCEGLDMTGMYLKDVPFQSGRNFSNAIWKDVHGDAFAFVGTYLSPKYEVLYSPSNDPEGRYILVGPYVNLKNRRLKQVDFSSRNLTGVNIDGTFTEWYENGCPDVLPDNYHCVSSLNDFSNKTIYIIMGPKSDLQFQNLENIDLSGVSLTNANLRYSYGQLKKCPEQLPVDWGCNDDDRYLLGPGADLSSAHLTNITTTPPWKGPLARCPDSVRSYTCSAGIIIGYSQNEVLDLTGKDITNIDFSSIRLLKNNSLLKGIHGKVLKCPLELPKHFECLNNRIIGPFVNIGGLNLTGFDLSEVKLTGAILKDTFGRVDKCPKVGMGYKCYDGHIIGMGYRLPFGFDLSGKDVSNIDFSEEKFLSAQHLNLYNVRGKVLNCFLQGNNVHYKWLCVQNRIIGPGVNVSGINMLEEAAVYDQISFENVSGKLYNCPEIKPKMVPRIGYSCVKNVFIAPGVDIRNMGNYFDGESFFNINVTDVKASGTSFEKIRISGTSGRMQECPSIMPAGMNCKHGYILGGHKNIAWGFKKPDIALNLDGMQLHSVTLWDNMQIKNTTWVDVIPKETISEPLISGSIDAVKSRTECSLISSSNIHCFWSDASLEKIQLIPSASNIPLGNFKSIEPLVGNMEQMTCSSGSKISHTYLDGVNLNGSDFQDCILSNVSGLYTGQVEWPSDCDYFELQSNKYIMCGNEVVLHGPMENITPDIVYMLNNHSATIYKNVTNINVENQPLSNIDLTNSILSNINGIPASCSYKLPAGWFCIEGTVILGPGQDLSNQNYENHLLNVTVTLENAIFNANTKLPPNINIENTQNVIGEGILNPAKNYQIQNNKLLGRFLKIVGDINVDEFVNKGPFFTLQMDLSEATFVTTQHKFRLFGDVLKLPPGYKTIPSYYGTPDNATWVSQVIGPDLDMPDIWDNINTICKGQNISNPYCHDFLDKTTFINAVKGIRGPLHTCYASGDFECRDNWLLGPGVDWKGYTGNIDIRESWASVPIHNLHTCPDDKYACIPNNQSTFTIFGPSMRIDNEYFDFSNISFVQTSLENTTIQNTVFANGHIEFESISNLILNNVDFINMTMTTKNCPDSRDFTKSYQCNGDGLYCVNNTIFTKGDVIPPNINIEMACLEDMVIEETPHRLLLSVSLENTILPDDTSNFVFYGQVSGKLKICPSLTPPGHICISKIWYTNKGAFIDIDVTGIDFSNMNLEQASMYNVRGIIKKCPTAMPEHWSCVEYVNKKTFVEEAMFIGAGIDYSKYDHVPDNINAAGINFKDAKFDEIKRFYGFEGIISRCPQQLPEGYDCYLYDIEAPVCTFIPDIWGERDQYVILGPYVNVRQLNLKNVCLKDSTNLIGIRGQTFECPIFTTLMRKKGFFCDPVKTDNFILGPGVALDNFDLNKLDNIAAEMPSVRLDFASIGGKLLVEQKETENNCKMMEGLISETCRNKYTDECSNNLPNYICDTSNLHLGTCEGLCGNNLTSYYSETLTQTYRTIKTNSVPNHIYHTDRVGDNGFEVCEHYLGIQMTQYPVKSNTFQQTCLGPVGILKSGALLYNHLENLQESFTFHQTTLDKCNGHADTNCFYHVHNISMELDCVHHSSCEHIGYMRDGFPLYSPCPGLNSCYIDETYTPGDNCKLDEANGIDFSGKNFYDPDGHSIQGYGYVVTNNFPFLPLKYAGKQIFDFVNLKNEVIYI